jgi:hypothetical protein
MLTKKLSTNRPTKAAIKIVPILKLGSEQIFFGFLTDILTKKIDYIIKTLFVKFILYIDVCLFAWKIYFYFKKAFVFFIWVLEYELPVFKTAWIGYLNFIIIKLNLSSNKKNAFLTTKPCCQFSWPCYQSSPPKISLI